MANLISNEALDMSNLNLFRLTAGYRSFNFYDNINYYYNGTRYSDVAGQLWDYNGQQRVSFFYGDNVTISHSGVTGGVITAYAEGLWNGANESASPTFAITGTSISARALYQAAQTQDASDDYAILGQALSGNDHIVGSAYADTLYGFSGDDIINAGAGNDYIGGGRGNDIINGGLGQDTVLYVGRYSDYKIRNL
jgi:Ca2+-binding RTX toxin-like protein